MTLEFPVDSDELMRAYINTADMSNLDKQYGFAVPMTPEPAGNLTTLLLKNLDYLATVGSFTDLSQKSGAQLDDFVTTFLFLLTRPDYTVQIDKAPAFIQYNALIANVVAISQVRNTDLYLHMVTQMSTGDLVKILILHNARNHGWIERDTLFNGNHALASLWYTAYFTEYHAGTADALTNVNLRKHLEQCPDKLSAMVNHHHIYFASSYIDAKLDHRVKEVINDSCKRIAAGSGAVIKNTPNPKSIAVVSNFVRHGTSVWRNQYGFIAALKEAGYLLTLVNVGPVAEQTDTSLFDRVMVINHTPNGMTMDPGILDNDFAVAYFPEVGMSGETIIVANMRLAPIQVSSYGHSVSTFGACIDFWLGGADVENADKIVENYSERVILMPGLGIMNVKPPFDLSTLPSKPTSERFIVNCSWYPQKVNPELLGWVKEIQSRCTQKNPLFRFFSGGGLVENQAYIPYGWAIVDALGGDNVEILGVLDYPTYMTKMAEGDLCLDSYPHGGCNTVVDALYLGLPIITLEGDVWRNRIGAAILRKVGLTNCIATSSRGFINMATYAIKHSTLRYATAKTTSEYHLYNRPEDGQHFVEAIAGLIQTHDWTQVEQVDMDDPNSGPDDPYLLLLEKVLTGSIYQDPGTVLEAPVGSGPPPDGYNQTTRFLGRDWPHHAHTMIGIARLRNIHTLFFDIHVNNVPGDLVECGVWRGGASIYMRALLKSWEDTNRKVYVCDSFQGLPKPLWEQDKGGNHHLFPQLSVSKAEVMRNFDAYGLLDDRVVFVEGWFKETLPELKKKVQNIALLRIDCDMYESTMQVLKEMYDLVSLGGYVIVDDYGNVETCRRAVDDFRSLNSITVTIQNIDGMGVYWCKTVDPWAQVKEGFPIPVEVTHTYSGQPLLAGPIMETELLKPVETQSVRPLFSVIVPVYNRTQYLQQCLQSIQANGMDNEIEVIVADDSDFQTSEEVGKLCWPHRHNTTHLLSGGAGLWRNVNMALQKTTGRWVHLLCDDDFVNDSFYRTVREVIRNHQHEVSMVVTDHFNLMESGQRVDHSLQGVDGGLNPHPLLNVLLDAGLNPFHACAVVFHRQCFEFLGVWREDMAYVADWEMYLRVASHGMRWWYVNHPLATCRQHSASYGSLLRQSGEGRKQEERIRQMGVELMKKATMTGVGK